MRALGCALLLAASASAASPLADPTLPPPKAAVAVGAPAPAPRQTLQFTLRRPDGTVSALLAGRWVRAGETVDLDGAEFRVEQVSEAAVVLARGEQRQVIEMAPQASQAVRCRRTEHRRSCR
jgi:hypothetical protein